MMFAIKAEVSDPLAEMFIFNAHKTMYGANTLPKAIRSSSLRVRTKAGQV